MLPGISRRSDSCPDQWLASVFQAAGDRLLWNPRDFRRRDEVSAEYIFLLLACRHRELNDERSDLHALA